MIKQCVFCDVDMDIDLSDHPELEFEDFACAACAEEAGEEEVEA